MTSNYFRDKKKRSVLKHKFSGRTQSSTSCSFLTGGPFQEIISRCCVRLMGHLQVQALTWLHSRSARWKLAPAEATCILNDNKLQYATSESSWLFFWLQKHTQTLNNVFHCFESFFFPPLHHTAWQVKRLFTCRKVGGGGKQNRKIKRKKCRSLSRCGVSGCIHPSRGIKEQSSKKIH